MPEDALIFNRPLYRKRRERVAKHWDEFDFLKREAAARLADCMDDMARDFSLALDLGCHRRELSAALTHKIKTIISADFSATMQPQIVCDEERLPFAPELFDAVVSALSLHHVNDLPGTFVQIRQLLKPDGLFLAIVPGASSLKELRASIMGASVEHGFALAPRLSPLIEVRDAGALLQRAGFALPVVDSDMLTVQYETPVKLLQDLHGMGESNILLEQQKGLTTPRHLAAICDHYEQHFANADGTIPATFEFITLTAWKPHASQQQAATRGSGKVNLTQALN